MLFLKKLTIRDVNTEYLKWLKDKKIQKYTDQINKAHTINKIKKYVTKVNKSKFDELYGIFLKKNIHIGNIKLSEKKNKVFFISYFIGNKKLHNKGIGTKVIKKITTLAKNKGAKFLMAGVLYKNISSIKILKKNKFYLKKFTKNKKNIGKLLFEKKIKY